MSSRRQKQVNQAIRRELSELLIRHVNDPRISGIISITGVDVSPDRIDADESETFEGLVSASDFLRHELGARLRLRYIPRLIFEKDDSIEKAERLFQLIDQSNDSSPGM